MTSSSLCHDDDVMRSCHMLCSSHTLTQINCLAYRVQCSVSRSCRAYLRAFTFQWEKLKAHRDELNEQAETAEYQIATISQEYRKVFQEKDSELRRLKTENQSLKEQQKRLIPQDDSGTLSPLKELAKPRFSHSNELHQKEISFGGGDGVGDRGLGDAGDVVMVDGWGEEFHDFGDVAQSEINQLQSELGSLKVECQHWKAVAQEKV